MILSFYDTHSGALGHFYLSFIFVFESDPSDGYPRCSPSKRTFWAMLFSRTLIQHYPLMLLTLMNQRQKLYSNPVPSMPCPPNKIPLAPATIPARVSLCHPILLPWVNAWHLNHSQSPDRVGVGRSSIRERSRVSLAKAWRIPCWYTSWDCSWRVPNLPGFLQGALSEQDRVHSVSRAQTALVKNES
jgi:hypothetical protein